MNLRGFQHFSIPQDKYWSMPHDFVPRIINKIQQNMLKISRNNDIHLHFSNCSYLGSQESVKHDFLQLRSLQISGFIDIAT